MPLIDNEQTRDILRHLFPGIEFTTTMNPSGQRLVYFCRFTVQTDVESQTRWAEWGEVVLKLSEDLHPTVIARMEKEREILNELSSGYFPRLLHSDVFSIDPVTEERFRNRLFITIEQRIGGDVLAKCRHLFSDERMCVGLLASLTNGLQLLWSHRQKIVHRDLKPENIIIRPDGSPVIIDLGIVREEGSAGVTATHLDYGPCTPAYASPEQLTNQKRFITFKSDFFSLGVIAYELITGANPFIHNPHDPLGVVVGRVLTDVPPTLESTGKASARFSALIEKLMAKEPYRRPRTPADLARELDEIVKERRK